MFFSESLYVWQLSDIQTELPSVLYLSVALGCTSGPRHMSSADSSPLSCHHNTHNTRHSPPTLTRLARPQHFFLLFLIKPTSKVIVSLIPFILEGFLSKIYTLTLTMGLCSCFNIPLVLIINAGHHAGMTDESWLAWLE